MKKYMNVTATVPSANAIGIPENITSKVAAANSRPIVNGLICALPLV